ncbi:MAG: cugP [Burkholderiaceae bacterium]|nr:cugP [Burkholderiaceae bacterium]
MIQVAMIFAAGRGERMRPLTDTTPKPLLQVAGKPLIVWQIEALARAGIRQIVINHAWLGAQISDYLGDGDDYGVQLYYSAEASALETAGGIAKALKTLQSLSDTPIFLAVSGDVYTDYDYEQLHAVAEDLAQEPEPHMHLIMVDNPEFHAQGDFVLHEDGVLYPRDDAHGRALTFGNIGLYDMRQFEDIVVGEKVAMSPYYRAAIERGHATGAYFDGVWENVGTPLQLAQLNEQLS